MNLFAGNTKYIVTQVPYICLVNYSLIQLYDSVCDKFWEMSLEVKWWYSVQYFASMCIFYKQLILDIYLDIKTVDKEVCWVGVKAVAS